MAVRLRISRLDRIRRARNFRELWSSLSNDEVFRLEIYYRTATGEEVITFASETSEEKWAVLREVVDALELAVSYMNRELAATGRETLEVGDDDEDYRDWLLGLGSRAAQAKELENNNYALAIADYMAGEIIRRAASLSKSYGDRFNELILYANSVETSDGGKGAPESAGQYECATHRGGCGKCPGCKRHSYCRGCLLCGLCSYPHVTVSNDPDKRFRVVKGGLYYGIEDREDGRLYDPREVFDLHAAEYRRCDLAHAERARVVEEIGYENCVAILRHRFDIARNPYDARELVDFHIGFKFG